MARLNAANNAQTRLVGDIADSATSFYVEDGSIFPAAPFMITIDAELMQVNTILGNLFSDVMRAQEGTAAASHAAESLVENRWTAGMYDSLALQGDLVARVLKSGDAMTGPLWFRQVVGSNEGIIAKQPEGMFYLQNKINGEWKPYLANSAEGEWVIGGNAVWHNGNLPVQEGNWTPVPARTGVNSELTYTSTGIYIKIGRQVTIQGKIEISAITSQGSGLNIINGMPFRPSTICVGAVGYNNIVSSSTVMAILPYIDNIIYMKRAVNEADNVGEDWAVGQIVFTATYFTA